MVSIQNYLQSFKCCYNKSNKCGFIKEKLLHVPIPVGSSVTANASSAFLFLQQSCTQLPSRSGGDIRPHTLADTKKFHLVFRKCFVALILL